jgi:hypothetical protein
MAWTAPKTWVGNEVPSAANFNLHLRDNMLETMPAKATTDGQIFAGNGTNSITPRLIAADRILTFETTSSTSYTNLATIGPRVTVTHSGFCIVLWSCQLQNNTANAESHMSWSYTGAASRAAADLVSVGQDAVSANQSWRLGNVDFLAGITPGTTTFTAEYRVDAGTASFSDRFLAVIPL